MLCGPNVCNKLHRPRYALSMTVLKRVIAVRLTKGENESRPSHCYTILVHFHGTFLRQSVYSFDIESNLRCIDIRNSKISFVYALLVTSSIYLPIFFNLFTTPRCIKMHNFLHKYILTLASEKSVLTKVAKTVLAESDKIKNKKIATEYIYVRLE